MNDFRAGLRLSQNPIPAGFRHLMQAIHQSRGLLPSKVSNGDMTPGFVRGLYSARKRQLAGMQPGESSSVHFESIISMKLFFQKFLRKPVFVAAGRGQHQLVVQLDYLVIELLSY